MLDLLPIELEWVHVLGFARAGELGSTRKSRRSVRRSHGFTGRGGQLLRRVAAGVERDGQYVKWRPIARANLAHLL
jgi:hypothetical protein